MSLDLDERQRAMLQEMDVHVWWPAPAKSVVPVAAAVAPVRPVPPSTPSVVPPAALGAGASQKSNTPIKIANYADSTRATDIKVSNFEVKTSAGVENMPWPALQQAVATCQACKLCEGRKNTVFGVGQPPAADDAAPRVDWLIVGEAPGENEDRTGEPFVGQAGKLLDNMLKAIGQERHRNVYIANVIKCRPPGNRNPEVGEVAQCEPYLRRQIELLQPKIILAMGRFAVNSLLQASVPDVHKLPLGKLRGQVHHYASAGRSVPVIATYHPAYLLRNLPEKAKAWADLCLALEVVTAGTSVQSQAT